MNPTVRACMVLLVTLAASLPVMADGFAQDVSDATFPTIGAVTLWPALTEGHDGLAEASRIADGQLLTLLVAGGLKSAVHEWRPDHSDDDSFPSGHTAAAFSLAGSMSRLHPKQQWLYLGAAALVGWSRVDLDKHYWHDVAAGAAIGYTLGRWAAGSDEGLGLGRLFEW